MRDKKQTEPRIYRCNNGITRRIEGRDRWIRRWNCVCIYMWLVLAIKVLLTADTGPAESTNHMQAGATCISGLGLPPLPIHRRTRPRRSVVMTYQSTLPTFLLLIPPLLPPGPTSHTAIYHFASFSLLIPPITSWLTHNPARSMYLRSSSSS